jgi:hypothetical protein
MKDFSHFSWGYLWRMELLMAHEVTYGGEYVAQSNRIFFFGDLFVPRLNFAQ